MARGIRSAVKRPNRYNNNMFPANVGRYLLGNSCTYIIMLSISTTYCCVFYCLFIKKFQIQARTKKSLENLTER